MFSKVTVRRKSGPKPSTWAKSFNGVEKSPENVESPVLKMSTVTLAASSLIRHSSDWKMLWIADEFSRSRTVCSINIFVFFGIATLMFDGSADVLFPDSKFCENSAVLFRIFINSDPSDKWELIEIDIESNELNLLFVTRTNTCSSCPSFPKVIAKTVSETRRNCLKGFLMYNVRYLPGAWNWSTRFFCE